MFDCYYCVFGWDWKRISINYRPNLAREVFSEPGEFIETAWNVGSMGWLLGAGHWKLFTWEKSQQFSLCKMCRLSNDWILMKPIWYFNAQRASNLKSGPIDFCVTKLSLLIVLNSVIIQWSWCLLCAVFSGVCVELIIWKVRILHIVVWSVVICPSKQQWFPNSIVK